MPARSNPAGRPDPAKRSLKDRASKAETSAARVFGRAKPDADLATIEPSVFALRDQWRAACATVNAGGHSDAEVDRLTVLATAAEEALIAAPVQTAAELACKVEALRQHISVDSLDAGLPHDSVLAICRGVELLACTAKTSQHSTVQAGPRGTDPILQAIDDHRAAFDAANSTVGMTDEAAEEAFWRWQRIYKALQAVTPTTPQGVCALAAHLRQFLKDGQNEIGTTFVDEAFTTLLNAIDRFSATGEPSNHRLAMFDLTGLDTRALDRMFDAYAAVSKSWNALGCLPFIRAGGSGIGSVWEYIDREAVRCALERDRISAELRSRQPQNDEERDMLLSARIKDELMCEGQIIDRDLLLEAVKAWG